MPFLMKHLRGMEDDNEILGVSLTTVHLMKLIRTRSLKISLLGFISLYLRFEEARKVFQAHLFVI